MIHPGMTQVTLVLEVPGREYADLLISRLRVARVQPSHVLILQHPLTQVVSWWSTYSLIGLRSP